MNFSVLLTFFQKVKDTFLLDPLCRVLALAKMFFNWIYD